MITSHWIDIHEPCEEEEEYYFCVECGREFYNEDDGVYLSSGEWVCNTCKEQL